MSRAVLAAAQSASVRGDIQRNVAEHVRWIGVAASRGVQLLVFPELSLTGYEPDLAEELQLQCDDPRIEPLRQAVRKHDLHVLVGGPLVSGEDRPHLGAILLSAEGCIAYAKIRVHESEAPYFAPGKQSCVVPVDGVATGIAICADTAHASHAANAAARGAKRYVVSVMKTADEYAAHAERLAGYAQRHGMAVLTANYAGSSGGRVSAGKSAFWDERGELVARAPGNAPALVVARLDSRGWRGEVVERS